LGFAFRLGLSKSPDEVHQVPYSKTLADYERFVNEMSVICTTWKQSQRLIEKYDEKQANTSYCSIYRSYILSSKFWRIELH